MAITPASASMASARPVAVERSARRRRCAISTPATIRAKLSQGSQVPSRTTSPYSTESWPKAPESTMTMLRSTSGMNRAKPTPWAIRRSFTAATIGWSWSRKEPSAPTSASAAGSPLSVAGNWVWVMRSVCSHNWAN